jgi:hypothetical protein
VWVVAHYMMDDRVTAGALAVGSQRTLNLGGDSKGMHGGEAVKGSLGRNDRVCYRRGEV